MAAHNVDVLIGARNNASATINKVKADIGGLDAQASKLGGAFQAAFVGGLGGVVGAMGLSTLAQMSSAIGEAVNAAGKINSLRAAFDGLAESAGQSGTAILAAMRRASYGMVADSELMLAANKASMLGVADSAEELTKLLEIARVRGKAMGLDIGTAFDNIVTGIGRESALILDNLGIVVDTEKAMSDYAKTLGVTADALDSVQRKQAILNQVMANTDTSGGGLPSGTAMAQAQLDRAQEEAQLAMGNAFMMPAREMAQLQADALTALTGKYDALAVATREARDSLADLSAGKFLMEPEDVSNLEMFVRNVELFNQAIGNGAKGIDDYGTALQRMATEGLQKGFSEEQANLLKLIESGLQAEIVALDTATQYAKDYDRMLIVMAGNEAQLAAQTAAVQATLEGMAAKLGMVGQMALGAASDVASFNLEVARIQGAIAVTEGIRSSAISKAQSLAMQALDQGADPGAVRQMLVETTDALEDLTLQYDDSSGAQYDNQLKTRGVTESLEDYTERLREANSASKKLASEGLKDLNKEYDDLKSKVSGVLQGALQTDVKVEGQDGQYKDAINENAKRLAAIANEGLINQPWLEEFANEVPGIFADLKLTEAAGGSVRDAAARMFADFQDGLTPELIDRDMAKERVKRMILGEQSMAALSAEIAAELAAEMGISLGEAQAAASSALGVKPTTGAMEKAGDGAAESGQAQKFVSAWVLEMNTQYTRIYATGVTSGEQWGTGFLTSVQNGVPSELIMLLVTLITPEVLAKIRAMQSQSGAIP